MGQDSLTDVPSDGSLEQSYRYCRSVARRRAKNFYYSFLLLPRDQRNAMCAIYAFMRYCDDLSDEPGATREPLERWRMALDHALAGRCGGHPTLPAFHDTVQRYKIPPQYFHEMIDGVSSDLQPRRIQIRTDAVDHLMEILWRDLVALHGIVKGRQRGMSATAARQRVIESHAPALQRLPRRPRLVTQVVAITH